ARSFGGRRNGAVGPSSKVEPDPCRTGHQDSEWRIFHPCGRSHRTRHNLSSAEGQQELERHLDGIDLLILDNLSTLLANGSEGASDAWLPMQNWLLKLRRRGVAVLLIHHAGVNGRQRGTSRREDALDTVIALRRPADYAPEEGARFEVHLEKLRNRAEGAGALPFEASIQDNGPDAIQWHHRDLKPRLLNQAAELFSEGMTVREVAATL